MWYGCCCREEQVRWLEGKVLLPDCFLRLQCTRLRWGEAAREGCAAGKTRTKRSPPAVLLTWAPGAQKNSEHAGSLGGGCSLQGHDGVRKEEENFLHG